MWCLLRKGILGYRREKIYTAAAKENKWEEAKHRKCENTNIRELGTWVKIKTRSKLTQNLFFRIRKEKKTEVGTDQDPSPGSM